MACLAGSNFFWQPSQFYMTSCHQHFNSIRAAVKSPAPLILHALHAAFSPDFVGSPHLTPPHGHTRPAHPLCGRQVRGEGGGGEAFMVFENCDFIRHRVSGNTLTLIMSDLPPYKRMQVSSPVP